MKKADVTCPLCGKINRGLDLRETDGWMECEHCRAVIHMVRADTENLAAEQNRIWQVLRPLPSGRRR